jgi:predicted molibdopterin-dependent oxidoreductase YjgC
VGAVTVKNKTKKSKQKSKRVLEMEADPETVWGKNKPLEEWWQSLASGKKVVLVEKNGEHKIFTMPTGKMTANKMYNTFDDDPNIVAVLSSNLSQDAYEVFLYPKAKDKSVKYVIKNYKKYFKSAGPMPADLVAKGIPAQKKVLFPA